MTSPFPGMDPYLESPTHWSDFHGTFIPILRESINQRLPENYIARVGEHVSVVAPVLEAPVERAYVPDVAVTRQSPSAPMLEEDRGGGGTMILRPPVRLHNIEFIDPHTETFIEIVRLPERELVTVIELLSPTNKYGEGRGEYMRKRREFLHHPVNLVEIDFLRAGVRLEFAEALPDADYYIFVSRAGSPAQTDAYTWSIREALPALTVPLRAPDADIHVPLRPAMDAAYQSGHYWKIIDYSKPPPPPAFSRADAQWMVELMSDASRGGSGGANH